LQVPAGLDRKRAQRKTKDTVVLPIVTEVTLWNGVPRVDFRVTVENGARDHRLRALFPLPFNVEHAITENQFHVAERPLAIPPWNGVSNEQPPTTFPQKTFAAFEADGSGLAVFNKGLQEGEVVRNQRGKQAYALTLLRCVGWLSRPDLVSRRGGAGPTIATEDSQMQGRHTFEYSLTSYQGTWREAGVQALGHAFCYGPLALGTNEHEGSLGPDMPLATFATPGVVPSAMHRSDEDGAPILRMYNAGDTDVTAALAVPAAAGGAGLVDLMDRPMGEVESSDGGWRVPLRKWQIASLRFGRR
jgi:alpha-mannosidase